MLGACEIVWSRGVYGKCTQTNTCTAENNNSNNTINNNNNNNREIEIYKPNREDEKRGEVTILGRHKSAKTHNKEREENSKVSAGKTQLLQHPANRTFSRSRSLSLPLYLSLCLLAFQEIPGQTLAL